MGTPLLRRRSAAGLALIVMATTLALIPSAPASAHSCAFPYVRLGSFALDAQPPPSPPLPVAPYFYWKEEGGEAFFIVWSYEWCVGATGDSVTWSTVATAPPGVNLATAGTDYTSETGTIDLADSNPNDDPHIGTAHPDSVTVNDVDLNDEQVESFLIRLTSSNGQIQSPSEAPMYIVDDDGPTNYATVAGGPISLLESGGTFKFPVLRTGDASTSTTVNLTYSALNGVDFNGPASVTFAANDRFEIASITAVNDTLSEPNETFTVTISGATDGPSQMSFTVIDNDGGSGDTTPPVTWFHHPKQNKDYNHGSLKARTIHVFIPVDDEDNPFGPAEPSGIDTTQFALRRLKTGGACQWWTAGRDWQAGGCGTPNWITYKDTACGTYISDRDLCEYDLKKDLAPSKGTKIRNYRVLSRAKDGAGNWETSFGVGRNKNTFEINKK